MTERVAKGAYAVLGVLWLLSLLVAGMGVIGVLLAWEGWDRLWGRA